MTTDPDTPASDRPDAAPPDAERRRKPDDEVEEERILRTLRETPRFPKPHRTPPKP